MDAYFYKNRLYNEILITFADELYKYAIRSNNLITNLI